MTVPLSMILAEASMTPPVLYKLITLLPPVVDMDVPLDTAAATIVTLFLIKFPPFVIYRVYTPRGREVRVQVMTVLFMVVIAHGDEPRVTCTWVLFVPKYPPEMVS